VTAARRAGAVAALFVLAVLVSGLGWLPTAHSAAASGFAAAPAAAPSPAPDVDRVEVKVVSMSPTTPDVTNTPTPLTIQLQLTNTTASTFRKLTVVGVRGDPISNQQALDDALANPVPPSAGDPLVATITPTHPVRANLGPHETTTVSFVTSTATPPSSAGICLCENRIYPLFLEATADSTAKGTVVLGSAQTFLPSFGTSQPKPMQVSWVWPLLDRPHRSTGETVFTDDGLATSIAGGRLDRLLQTVQLALTQDPSLSMTLLVDPDLIDELAVMAAGSYQVQTSATSTTAGTGTAAAKSWLARLRTCLDEDPNLQLAFTPLADPDVRSLATHGVGWATALDSTMQQRVTEALGGRAADSDISWPLGNSLNRQTLDALVRSGVRTVVVDDQSVPGSTREVPQPDALAPVSTPAGSAKLAIASSQLDSYADAVVSVDGTGVSTLPDLVAQVAVRAEQDGSHGHYVVIAPDRSVDPDPTAASAAILATADTSWSSSLSLGAAAAQVDPVHQGGLHPRALKNGLPDETITAAQYLAITLPTVDSLLTPPPHAREVDGIAPDAVTAATTLVSGLPLGIQRAESAEWSDAPATSGTLAQSLADQVRGVVNGVQLVKPAQGSYTLGSNDSLLPVTIDNTLTVPVYVRLKAATVGGLPGFSTTDLGVQQVAPRSKLVMRLPARVDRAGRIPVNVALTTPSKQALGAGIQLSVRSTALGNIGKIITYGAGAILAAALLFRFGRQWWRRHNGTAPRRAPVEVDA
jgi:hypothetical protein